MFILWLWHHHIEEQVGILYMVYITPESAYITSGGVYADLGAVIILNWWSPICQKVVERDYVVYTAVRHHAWSSSQTCNCQWHSSVVSLVFDGAFPVSTLVLHLCPWCEHMTAHTVDFCVFFTMMGFSAASISSLESVASKTLLCLLLVWCWKSRPLHVWDKVVIWELGITSSLA